MSLVLCKQEKKCGLILFCVIKFGYKFVLVRRGKKSVVYRFAGDVLMDA